MQHDMPNMPEQDEGGKKPSMAEHGVHHQGHIPSQPEYMQAGHHHGSMVADFGIAIGAGTDVAVATADVVLVRSNPQDVVSIIKLSRATYRKMIQNMAWATGYNIIAIPLAAGAAYSLGIVLNPAVGAALMALSTIIVAINARFLRVEK